MENQFIYQNSFRQLIVWQKAKELTLRIYNITKGFPKEETYALVSQLRRASSSVMANIAEGNERVGVKDRLKFFNQAKSSLVEVDCFWELAENLGYLNERDYLDVLECINKTAYLLNKFMFSQKSQQSQRSQ